MGRRRPLLLVVTLVVVVIVTLSATHLPVAHALAARPRGIDSKRSKSAPSVGRAFTVAACGWTLATTAAVANANAIDVAKGSQIFEANCMQCHPGGQNLIVKERNLHKEAIEKYVGLENVLPFVQTSLTHRGALIMGGKLSDEDFRNVVGFVVEQATQDKWPELK